jgi:hypothetical protein
VDSREVKRQLGQRRGVETLTAPNGGTGSEPYQRIINRAMSDPDFRTRLLENPQMAIEEDLGTPLSSSAPIRVIEEQPGEVILVLPALSTLPSTTLSDEDLEQVAGGLSASTCATLCIC